jgi:secernin
MHEPLSCDTSVALGPATFDGSAIFAKNSDRPANECQPLTHAPGRRHAPGATLRCQYLEIPQVAETWEVIGSRPYWLWGFEMGVNEWGVAIGNEAVFSCEPYEEVPALIGMDLVRLGLERGRSADEALRVITALVERHGQGGSCDAATFRTYHNSFIVADPTTAWVLETFGRRWTARRVRDRAAISNLYTIGEEWDACSPGAVERARAGLGRRALQLRAGLPEPRGRPRPARLPPRPGARRAGRAPRADRRGGDASPAARPRRR